MFDILCTARHAGRFVVVAMLLGPASVVAQTANSPAHAAESAPGWTVKGMLPGDATRTCPQILAEVHFRNEELNLLQEAMNKVEVNPSAETEAIAAAAQAVGLLSMALPVPAPVVTAIGTAGATAHVKSFSNDIKKAYAPLQTQFDFALDRMDMLHGLYQRRCTAGGR